MPPSEHPWFPLVRGLVIAVLGLATLLAGCASREEKIQRVQTQAETALFDNDPQLAMATLRDGLERFPDANQLRIALSRVLASQGLRDEAATLLEDAVALDPELDELWVTIGELRAQLGESEAATEAFEQYLTHHGSDFLAWKALCLEYERQGKLTDAIKAAARWNELTPSAQPSLKLGQLYLESGNVPQARSWLGQAAAYRNDGAAREALAELIHLETRLTQFPPALTLLEEYETRYGGGRADPRIREASGILGNWQRAREEIAQAAAALEREQLERQEQAEWPSEAEGDARPAEGTAGGGEAQSAPPAPETQDEAEPELAASTGQEASRPPERLFGDDDVQEEPPPHDRVEAAEPPSEPDPPSGGGREQATAAVESGDFDTAIPLLWQQLGQNENQPELWYQLSRAYYSQQNWFDSEACILEALRRAPDSPPIVAQYLKTLSHTRSLGAVVQEAQTIRQAQPNAPELALAQARALREIQAPASAITAAYRDFLQRADQRHPAYREATRYLQTGN